MPVAFKCPVWYRVIEEFVRKFDLFEVQMSGYKDKKIVRKILQAREHVCDIRGLSMDEAVVVWKKLQEYEITNRQRDIVWMAECFAGERGAEKERFSKVGKVSKRWMWWI